MHAARVGQDQRRSFQGGDKRAVRHRCAQPHARSVGHRGLDHRLDRGIGVDRPEEFDIGEPIVKLADGLADLEDRLAETVPTVRRDQDQTAGGIEIDPDRDVAPGGHEQCIDHRVSRYDDRAGIDSFPEQVLARRGGRCQVEGAQVTGQDPVGFFGERRIETVGSQAGLDVAEGDVIVEAGQRRRQHGRGVALRQDHVGPFPGDRVVDRRQQPGRQLDESLVRPHDVEVEIGLDPEEPEHRIGQLAMLPRAEEPATCPGRRLEGMDHRRHLDRLGTGPDRAEDRLEPLELHALPAFRFHPRARSSGPRADDARGCSRTSSVWIVPPKDPVDRVG